VPRVTADFVIVQLHSGHLSVVHPEKKSIEKHR